MEKYIKNFIELDNKILLDLLKEEKERKDIQPSVGLQVGKLIGLLIRMINAKKVLEFGTCLGYSTIWLAEAVKYTGGNVTSIEYNKDLFQTTKKNLELANLIEYVNLIHGDANKIINTFNDRFDLILQDSSKSLYPIMIDKSIELLKKNGILIADDTLFKPLGIPKEYSEPVDQYNKIIFSKKNLYSTILPIGDGITLSVKLSD